MAALTLPATFTPHVNDDFVAPGDDGVAHRFTLKSVTPRIDNEVQLSFSLLFQCPGVVQPQRIYQLSHPRMGDVPLFLGPIQQKRDGVVYEAVFNLLKDEVQ